MTGLDKNPNPVVFWGLPIREVQMSDRTKVEGQQIDLVAMMNRRKVINELRSGKHEQFFGSLLCWWQPDGPTCWAGVASRALYGYDEDHRKQYPTRPVFLDLAKDLKMNVGQFISKNDCQKLTFEQLADEMEALPPPLNASEWDALAAACGWIRHGS